MKTISLEVLKSLTPALVCPSHASLHRIAQVMEKLVAFQTARLENTQNPAKKIVPKATSSARTTWKVMTVQLKPIKRLPDSGAPNPTLTRAQVEQVLALRLPVALVKCPGSARHAAHVLQQ